MVLYHAVSSYQLLEVILHRMVEETRERAVLLLPDFIVKKYPWYQKLRRKLFFDEVYLFPYSAILHREEEQIRQDVRRQYERLVPHSLQDFSRIYIAGAHFYFSLYVIACKRPFIFLEDGAGMLSRAEELYEGLAKTYPIHAEIAEAYGLYDGKNAWVKEIICLKAAQAEEMQPKLQDRRYTDFSVERSLAALSGRRRRSIIRLFLKHRMFTRADAILLTQHFSHLGMMSEEEQEALYRRLYEQELKTVQLLIKRHPDDEMDYRRIFPKAKLIRSIFPSELLPYVFWKKPKTVYTLDSTGCENLREHFQIRKLGREKYGK